MLRHVFLNRLTSYFVNGAGVAGFIPNVVKLLEKYHLSGNLYTYMRDSIFPSISSWKRMVKCEINNWELYQWHSVSTYFHGFSRSLLLDIV